MALKTDANLKENWLVLPKITWRIWQIFTRALESLRTGTFKESFFFQTRKCIRGSYVSHNEKWCKIWRRIFLQVQNWHEKFAEFWPKHSKNLKHLHFNELLLTKVYNVWAKKAHRCYVWRHWKLMQNWRKLTCAF